MDNVPVSSITGGDSTLPSASLPSCRVMGTVRYPLLGAVSKSSASTARIRPVDALTSKRWELTPSPSPKVRMSPSSRSVAVRRSSRNLPASPSGMDWLPPPTNRGGALMMGSAVIAAVASLSALLPGPRGSI